MPVLLLFNAGCNEQVFPL